MCHVANKGIRFFYDVIFFFFMFYNYGLCLNMMSAPDQAHFSNFFVFLNEQKENQDSMILCSNITGLKMFHSITHIVMDGTFCYAPTPFFQVYMIFYLLSS
jgi:hypothetical protein